MHAWTEALEASRRLPRAAALAFALLLAMLTGSLAASAALASTHATRPGGGHEHKAPPPPEISLAPAPSGGVPVTMAPIGLSLEYPVMAEDLGTGACPPPALVSALQQLGSPPLSLAGASQDMTAPSGALPSPPTSWETATLYSLPAAFWSQLHCLLNTTKDPLTVGLNARSGNLAWAAQMVAGAQSAATNGVDFSLGNEPDLYDLPNYASLDKPQAGEESIAVNTYLQIAGYLQPALAGAAVIGPELARPAHWQHELPRVIAALHPQTVGVHLYPLTTCATPKAVTIGGLLSSQAANTPRALAWVVADAGAAGVPAIISEANSASCGGLAGVSDSPAAAVWAVRFVLNALKTGFHEVRFHFSGGAYDPFVLSGETVLTRPLDSALIALNQWLPVGSTLQSLAGVRHLVVSHIEQPSGTSITILDNESAHAQAVLLRGLSGASVQTLSPAQAGVLSAELPAPRDRLKLSIAPNSVLAVTPAP
jgi:hypothetical protein